MYKFTANGEPVFGASEITCIGKTGTYKIKLSTGLATCSCPAFAEWGNCKHLRYLGGIMTVKEKQAMNKVVPELEGFYPVMISKGDQYIATEMNISFDEGFPIRVWGPLDGDVDG